VAVSLQVVGGRNAGQEIAVRGRRFLIGRASDCHLRAHSEQISRYHCALLVEKEGVFVRDYGSRNGTLVDGQRILDQIELQDGQRLRIGPLEFLVCIRPERSGVAGKDTVHGKSASDTLHTAGKPDQSPGAGKRTKPPKTETSVADAARSIHDAPDAIDVLEFLAEPAPDVPSKPARSEAPLPSLDDFLAAEKAAAEAGKTPEPPPPAVDTSDAALEGLKKIFTPKKHSS
jgi:predicted component of type VI protein secretion system